MDAIAEFLPGERAGRPQPSLDPLSREDEQPQRLPDPLTTELTIRVKTINPVSGKEWFAVLTGDLPADALGQIG